MPRASREAITAELLALPARAAGWRYWAAVVGTFVVMCAGIMFWLRQVRQGLAVTGLNQPVYWGIYITNFVFFIGIAHVGALTSAILRLAGAEWRRPVVRLAESITVFSLLIATAMIFADVGHPERLLNIVFYGRIESPLIWDVLSVGTYLLASVVYLYLPLIPDIALMRQRLQLSGWKSVVCRWLALNWRGTARQEAHLERAMRASTLMIVPLAISVHTVVSYVFAVTVRPMWHSTIFGPYFVIGALYSGVAALLLVMAVVRRSLRLHAYIGEPHFRNLCALMLVLCGLWFYATVGEHLIAGYGNETADVRVITAKTLGEYAWVFWSMMFAMLTVVLVLVPLDRALKAVHLPTARVRPSVAFAMAWAGWAGWFTLGASAGLRSSLTLLAGAGLLALLLVVVVPSLRRDWFTIGVWGSLFVLIGMWLERLEIVVPTLTRPIVPTDLIGTYGPSLVELAVTAGALATLGFLYLLLAKAVPLLPVWEITRADWHTENAAWSRGTASRVGRGSASITSVGTRDLPGRLVLAAAAGMLVFLAYILARGFAGSGVYHRGFHATLMLVLVTVLVVAALATLAFVAAQLHEISTDQAESIPTRAATVDDVAGMHAVVHAARGSE